MFERLATSVTALSQRIDRITVQEFVDCSGVAGREMLVDLMGMGKQPEEITVESPMFRSVSVQYEQAIGASPFAWSIWLKFQTSVATMPASRLSWTCSLPDPVRLTHGTRRTVL